MAHFTDVVRCPSCNVRLGVPDDFRTGTCPGCKVRLMQAPEPKARRRRRNPEAGESKALKQAKRRYEDFHGVPPAKVRNVPISLPSTWFLQGDLTNDTSISYAPPDNSERRNTVFSHDFGDLGGRKQKSKSKLYVDPTGKYMLILGNFHVNGRGIVG